MWRRALRASRRAGLGPVPYAKNLAMAMSAEAAEVMDIPVAGRTGRAMRSRGEEGGGRDGACGRVLYLVRLSDRLGVDLLSSADERWAINARTIQWGSQGRIQKTTPRS